jgi:Zn-dependent M16 (insulinase) family peptidase
MEQGVLFSSYSLDDNLPYMLNLWEDLFCRCAPYQEQRLRTIINIAANNAAMSVSNSGHILAVRSASSGLTPSASMSEIFSGLTQVKFLKELSELEDLSDVVHKLACVAAEVLDCGSLRCAVNTGKSSLSTVYGTMDAFVQSLPGKYADMSSLVEVHDFSVVKKEMNHQFGFPVNYVGFSIKTVPYQHKDSPSLAVLAKLMTLKYLHKEIRYNIYTAQYGSVIQMANHYKFAWSFEIPTYKYFGSVHILIMHGEFTITKLPV